MFLAGSPVEKKTTAWTFPNAITAKLAATAKNLRTMFGLSHRDGNVQLGNVESTP